MTIGQLPQPQPGPEFGPEFGPGAAKRPSEFPSRPAPRAPEAPEGRSPVRAAEPGATESETRPGARSDSQSRSQSGSRPEPLPRGEPVVSVRDLVKSFDDRVVLSGINLDVYAGETMVIMGGSGSGKSTLLRHMIGSLRPDGGRIALFGKDICGLKEDGLNAVRRRFGILFQSGALFNSMTIADNVALPLEEHTDLSREIIDIQVKIKLELVGLREHAGKYPAEISGGMKKRAGLARALALDPKILFYDEPSAGLDPVTSAEIDRLIIDLAKKIGVTSVVVTHEMDSAFAIADRMAMLDKGRMIKVASRRWYHDLRRRESAEGLGETDAVIRQFLRGDAEGPITARRAATHYAEDLLGHVEVDDVPPAIQASR